MGTLKHYFELGAVYFVTSVTHSRKQIFRDAEFARFLIFSLGYHKYIMDFNLFGYVIMPDHIHLLIQPKSEKNNISKIMQHIKGNFARKYNELTSSSLPNPSYSRHLSAYYGAKPTKHYTPVWQESFYETGLRDEKSFFKWLEYMHYNPVKAGLCEDPKLYEFSSNNQYHLGHRAVVQLPLDRI